MLSFVIFSEVETLSKNFIIGFFVCFQMTKPIGVRIDEEIRTKMVHDAKKSGVPMSTYASKILTDWTKLYKPMLESDSILYPIPILRIFYNFVKEDDYETIAKMIAEYWHDSMKSRIKSPKYEDYLESLESWLTSTHQNLSILEGNPVKHVIRHSWGFSYSKITCHVMKETWESLGWKFEEAELKENMFSYSLHEIS